MSRYTTEMMFKDFREDYPNLWRRGSSFENYNDMTIRVRIPGVGKVIYNPYKRTIEWEEKYKDPQQVKEEEREKRLDLYDFFLEAIEYYQRVTGLSQDEIAEFSGMSRASINRYLNLHRMPTTKIMLHILNSLGIEIPSKYL